MRKKAILHCKTAFFSSAPVHAKRAPKSFKTACFGILFQDMGQASCNELEKVINYMERKYISVP